MAGVLWAGLLALSTGCGAGNAVVQGAPAGTTAAGPAGGVASAAPSGAGTAAAVGGATPDPVGTATTGPGRTVRPTPAPVSTAPPPVTGGVLRLGPADEGHTFTVRRGTSVVLDLGPSGPSWDTPLSDDPTVIRETSHRGGYPDPGPVSAQYRAVAPGTAHITATSDAPCLHSTPRCMIAQREFRVTIVVRS